ncbi:3-deoxy-7-phosphoheptulonate synthase [Aeromonas allosaccharophila]|uniref:Phospho-2-dehydro-3-deoxyheptonate aldolase n=1 Tax=Aeromonas allosaccharophila TaxID=656 RepID=A0AAX3NVL0_9GAMM|nr:3-deoxy-7-phosphoheptulonate synthase [Aeromonas allosaccharophila]WED78169.1 3-deoxy-7-phosphoheptulonate synthase [Aeromonas allosaccharophila]
MFTSLLNASPLATLPTPDEMLKARPCPARLARQIARSRQQARHILQGEDDRLLLVIGPCSIHDPVAARDYGGRLAELQGQYEEQLQLVMRTYFEKPRTTLGWKGFIFDPDLDGSDRLEKGLSQARELLLALGQEGLACATEFLDLTSMLYLGDLISWGAIGARTTESQLHRQLASALPCPIGFKNGTDGNIRIAVEAILASRAAHLYTQPSGDGQLALVRSHGNPDCHLILRGGRHPNYQNCHVAEAGELLRQHHLSPRLMVDCSHGNSQKQHARQLLVAQDIADQLGNGCHAIAAIMVESFICEGRQEIGSTPLRYGQSITDSCIGWEQTRQLLDLVAEGVEARRQQRIALAG